jgi:hypothetical protein
VNAKRNGPFYEAAFNARLADKLIAAGFGIRRGGEWAFLTPLVEAHPEQKKAVLELLRSRDLVTSVRGPAGSGKTSMMKEAVKALAALAGRDSW